MTYWLVVGWSVNFNGKKLQFFVFTILIKLIFKAISSISYLGNYQGQ